MRVRTITRTLFASSLVASLALVGTKSNAQIHTYLLNIVPSNIYAKGANVAEFGDNEDVDPIAKSDSINGTNASTKNEQTPASNLAGIYNGRTDVSWKPGKSGLFDATAYENAVKNDLYGSNSNIPSNSNGLRGFLDATKNDPTYGGYSQYASNTEHNPFASVLNDLNGNGATSFSYSRASNTALTFGSFSTIQPSSSADNSRGFQIASTFDSTTIRRNPTMGAPSLGPVIGRAGAREPGTYAFIASSVIGLAMLGKKKKPENRIPYYKFFKVLGQSICLRTCFFVSVEICQNGTMIYIRKHFIQAENCILSALSYSPAQTKHNVSIVLTHGYTASKESVDLTASYLAKRGYACLTYDVRGHKLGNSGSRVSSVPQLVDDLNITCHFAKQLFQSEGLVLAGHSMGGILSLKAVTGIPSAKAVVVIAAGPEPTKGFLGPVGQAMLSLRGDYVEGISPQDFLSSLEQTAKGIDLPLLVPSLFVAAQGDVLVSLQKIRTWSDEAGEFSEFASIDGSHLEAPDKSRGIIARWLDSQFPQN